MIVLSVASIKAACECAAKKDVRYYLNGIQIQVREDQTVRVRATDGHIAFEDQMQDLATTERAMEIIIPLESVKLIGAIKQHKVNLQPYSEGRWICGNIAFTPIEGKFPDVDRVMPKRQNITEINQYDPDLLARCQKAMRIATGNNKAYFRLQHGNCGLMHREVEAFPRCAVMSLNENKTFLNN